MDKKSSKLKQNTTKNHLKTMTKTGQGHKMRTAGRVMKYGSISFIRNIWLSIAATLVMSITLLILFVTVIASLILTSTAEDIRNKIDIIIFFQPSTSAETLDEMYEIMKAEPNVREITVLDSAAEYDLTLHEHKDDGKVSTVLNDTDLRLSLLNSMPATMRIKVHDIENLNSIRQIVETNPLFIDNLHATREPTYNTKRMEIDTIKTISNIAQNGGIILSIVFLVISVLVIFNTIRMAIFSRREEINLMKLVGADNSFIRGPFRVEAQMCGAISGIIAGAIGYFGFHFLTPYLQDFGINTTFASQILESPSLILVFAGLILIGIIIGTISAHLAIRKYLH